MEEEELSCSDDRTMVSSVAAAAALHPCRPLPSSVSLRRGRVPSQVRTSGIRTSSTIGTSTSTSSSVNRSNNNNNTQKQQQQQQHTALRHSITTTTTTNHHHHHHSRTRRTEQDDTDRDRLGERILELLLLQSSSRTSTTSSRTSSSSSSFMQQHFVWKKPILNRHNFKVLRQLCGRWCQSVWVTTTSAFPFPSPPLPPLRTSIFAVVTRLLLLWIGTLWITTTVSAVLITVTSLAITGAILVLGYWSLDLLLDCSHHNLPITAIKVRQSLRWCCTIFDLYVAQGRQFRGRTRGTTTSHDHIYLVGGPSQPRHCTTASSTTTTTTTITDTPLQCQHQQQQQQQQCTTTRPDHSSGTRYSTSTTRHWAAVQYCWTVQQQFGTITTTASNRNSSSSSRSRSVIVQSDHNATEVLEGCRNDATLHHDHYDDGMTTGTTSGTTTTTTTTTTYPDTRSSDTEAPPPPMHESDVVVGTLHNNADLAWIDVGAQIGYRLLHSEHVQRAMALPDTKERILETMNHHHHHKAMPDTATTTGRTRAESHDSDRRTFHHHAMIPNLSASTIASQDMTTTCIPKGAPVVPPKPIHTMWTSPGSAAAVTNHSTRLSQDEATTTIRTTGHHLAASDDDNTNHHVDHEDNDGNDGIPTLRQSQSYPISPCSPRTLSLWWSSSSSRPAPPLPSPLATRGRTIPGDPHPPLPELPFMTTNDRSDVEHDSSLLETNQQVVVPDSTAVAPQRCLSSRQYHPKNDIINQARGSAGGPHQPGRILHRRRVPLLAGTKVAVPMSPVLPPHYCHTGGSTTRTVVLPKCSSSKVSYMMSTVVRSQRIHVNVQNSHTDHLGGNTTVETETTNCLSVTVKLDKFFLRHGEFGELTFRVLDEWSSRYMPRHSKVPIGACVATSYGIGVLVGWRVEDDCHIVRSLWQCRGSGSAYAYMNRHSIHQAMVAANGFRVQTVYGWGIVQACVKGGTAFTSCRYFVEIREENSRHKGNVLELDDTLILSCHGAQFMPVIEHVRAAATYQIQLDNYNASLREQQLLRGENSAEKEEQEFLRTWSSCADILWKSFLKAVEEDKDFDEGVHDFVQSIIEFLDRLDKNDDQSNVDATAGCNESEQNKVSQHLAVQEATSDEIEIEFNSTGTDSSLGQHSNTTQEPGFWFMNDLFGGIFKANNIDSNIGTDAVSVMAVNYSDDDSHIEEHKTDLENDTPVIKKKKSYFNRAFAVIRTIMKTVSIARASSVDHTHFRLALAISYDILLFVRTILKIQQRNTSVESLRVWKRAWGEIIATFGPIQERLESIGRGIANRMEHQGRKAKVRLLKFVDTILGDERLLFAMEQGEWDRCLARVEIALVEAEVIEEKNLIYYRKAATFIFDHVQMLLRNNEGAAARNNEKLAILGHLIQAMAAPRRSILKIFCREDMLELFERILVRAYYKEEVATRMLTIHAATFHSLRHLRILKDFSVSGRIWMPLLDAADEELSWFVSTLPDNSKGIMLPVSRLFSLCVAQFHKINDGDLSKDWLAFLLEEESVQIIQEIDMLLILGFESFSRDIREMMTVLPYYASIDDDILNLMDEVNLDEFLKEAASAIDNPDMLADYIREKATIAIERFLNYLPKMSIPVEKRELGDGWVLSCHGSDGGGLTLTDVTIRRENLVCQIMGGDTLFFPMFNDNNENLYHDTNAESFTVPTESSSSCNTNSRCDAVEEESILDHIKILILNAQTSGCWKIGFGGVCQAPTDPYAASIFGDIPVSNILNCAIDLWRNLQIDDDDLLEIAIRDISYHIQLQQRQEEAGDASADPNEYHRGLHPSLSESTSTTQVHHGSTSMYNNSHSTIPHRLSSSSSLDGPSTSTRSQHQQQHRFNPRVDPTVLFLEIKRLTLNLDNFFFRIEKAADKKTVFDPVFAGRGMLSLQNISIRLRVECAKERVKQPTQQTGGSGAQFIDIVTPILQLRQLEVSLEKLSMIVKDTGFGSDWILNKAVEVFEEKLTEVVVTNLKDQIQEQLVNILENLNSYFLINPNLLLNILGISINDLDENVVWV